MKFSPSSGRKPGRVRNVLLVALALALAAGCSLKKPVAPSWEVEYNIPLLNQWIDIVDLFENDDFTDVGTDSVYFFEFEESLDRVTVGTEVTIDDIDQSVSQAIGAFTVPAATPQFLSVSLGEIYPPVSGLLPGTVIPSVPVFSLPSPLTKSLSTPLDNFTQVTIDSGTVTLSVTNNTRVPYTTLGVRLLDVGAGSTEIVDVDIAAVATGGTLDHGENVILPVSLAGKSIGNQLDIDIYGSSPGESNAFTLDGTEGIDIDVTVGELRVSSAIAEVGEINYDFTGAKVTIPGGSDITSARLSSGDMTLSIDNQLPIPFELTIDLPNVTDSGGAPVNLILNAPAGGLASQTVDLSNHTLAPNTEPSGDQTLSLTVNAYSVGSAGGQVTLTAGDSVAVRAVISNLVIDSVSGILDPTTVDIDSTTFELTDDSGNLLDELRKIQLSEVELEMTVRHTIGFPGQLDLHLIGEGGSPDPVTQDINFTLNAGSDAAPDTSVLVLSDVVNFLNAFPTTVTYFGSFTVGDGVTPGTVSSDSYLEADLRFHAPLSFDVTETIVIELDKEFQDKGMTATEGFDEIGKILETTLTYRLASTMGLELRTRFTTAADSSDVYTDPDVDLVLVLQYPAATAADTIMTITEDQWDSLRNPFWSGVQITIPPTGGTPFRVAKNDRLYIKAFATVRALIDPEGNGGGKGGGR